MTFLLSLASRWQTWVILAFAAVCLFAYIQTERLNSCKSENEGLRVSIKVQNDAVLKLEADGKSRIKAGEEGGKASVERNKPRVAESKRLEGAKKGLTCDEADEIVLRGLK